MNLLEAAGVAAIAIFVYRHFNKRKRRMMDQTQSDNTVRTGGDYYPASPPVQFDGGNAPQIAVTGWGEF